MLKKIGILIICLLTIFGICTACNVDGGTSSSAPSSESTPASESNESVGESSSQGAQDSSQNASENSDSGFIWTDHL